MNSLGISELITRNMKISVSTEYIESRSDPKSGYYFFSYTVTLTNQGPETIQLLARHWLVTDSTNRTEQIRGLGVVGEQPIIKPGESYTYTSFCPLPTPFGTMEGSYQVINQEGEEFDLIIPIFTLAHPHSIH